MNSNDYLVVGRTNGTTRLGSPFCNLRLKNEEEEINLAVWDVASTEAPAVGQLVRFAYIQDNDGKRSARKADMLPLDMVMPGHPLYGLLPHPIERELWKNTILHLLDMSEGSELNDLIAYAADKLFDVYSQYPAATSIHHAFCGGLLNHTYQMLHMLEGLYPCLPYPVRLDHCTLAILFHDYGKVMTYTRSGDNQPIAYQLGHVYISANALQQELERRNIAQEEVNAIVHIVLAHHGQLEFGSPVMPCSMEAVIVHMLDNISAKTDTIENCGNMEYSSALLTHVVKQAVK